MLIKLFAENTAKYLEWLGIIAILSMLVFTTIDVTGTNIFNRPLRGGTEMVSFAQIVAISSAIAINFFLGRHISIEFIVTKLPAAFRVVAAKIISLFCLMFFVILTWQSLRYGSSLYSAGEISSSANIPLYPFAYFIAVSAATAALYFVTELFENINLRKFYAGNKQKIGGTKSGTS